MNIKKEVGKVQDELIKYGLMTPGKGLDWPVSVSIENMENASGKVTKHIVAKWNEVVMDTFSYNTTGEKSYMYEDHMKVEELNKYFHGELFTKGITQKAVWIKADFEDKVEYLKVNQFGHPALFPVWLESKKVA
jgi:uncharacterized membrane protein